MPKEQKIKEDWEIEFNKKFGHCEEMWNGKKGEKDELNIKSFISFQKQKSYEEGRKDYECKWDSENVDTLLKKARQEGYEAGSAKMLKADKETIKMWKKEGRQALLKELIEEIKKYIEWPKPKPGAGAGLGALAGTGMYVQYDIDRKKHKEQIEAIIQKLKEKL